MAGIGHHQARTSRYYSKFLKQMIANSSTLSLLERFPHLQREIRRLAEHDSSFRQLNEDYELLLRSIENSNPGSVGDKEDMISLKTSLEAEALEKLSRTSTWKLNQG